VDQAVSNAREINQAATLIYALTITPITAIHCGSFAAASAQLAEGIALADKKSAVFFKAGGSCLQGCILALSGEVANSVRLITSGLEAWRGTGATLFVPLYLSNLARAYAALGRSGEARRCIDEAICTIATTKGKWFEAEAIRVAGEIALKSPEPDDAGKAERYFERALAIARKQEAKSWELRAAMSMARLWRDQGNRQQARGLLASVYGWFTEGFDTLDLKEARALLDTL
jgi:predicted ATPase